MAGPSQTHVLAATPPSFESTRPSARVRLGRLVPRFMRPHAGEQLDKTRVDRTRKDWVLDVLAFVTVVVIGIAIHVDATQNRPEIDQPWLILDAVLLPVGSGLLFWRRRWPFAVAIALALLGIASPSTAFASLVAAYALAAYAPQNRAFLGLLVLVITVPITAGLWPNANNGDHEGNSYLADVLLGVIATVAAFSWGLFAGARRALLLTLEDRAARAESEQQLRVDQARQQERTRIAREMHDVLAHRMSLLSVHAGALEFRPDAPPEDIARAAGVIRATAHEALEELRTVIGVMRVADATGGHPGDDAEAGSDAIPEAPQPTLAAVPHLVEEWRAAGSRIDLALSPSALDGVPTTVSRTAYRIVQESLTNAGKHAPSAKITVEIGGAAGDTLTVSVINAISLGTPASAIPGTGLGLVGLSERTELVGGVFAAGVDPDLRRFVVEARLPWGAA